MSSSEQRRIEVLPDAPALVARALDLVLQSLEAALADHGRFTIALSGGSTPKSLYGAIAQQSLPWDKIHVFWGDERYVPHDHPDSNAHMARQAWLDQVPIPPENIHPMPTDAGDPAVDAARYAQDISGFFEVEGGVVPRLDLILLGMGDDGHTASLFPHTEALEVRDRLVTVGNKDGQPRITFTVPLINQGARVAFMVAGANKQNALAQVLAPDGDAAQYPSRLIQPQGTLYWLLDAAAAQALPPHLQGAG